MKFEEKSLDREYIKNVLLQYFVYFWGNNMKEAQILEHVLFTIFRFKAKDIKMIEEAKGSVTLWARTKWLLTGGAFYEDSANHDSYYNPGA